MRIGELADRAQVSQQVVRYYEAMGLLQAARLPNGYRDYDDGDVRVVEEIRQLTGLGIRVEDTRPFVDCLVAGHEQGDDCLASVAVRYNALALPVMLVFDGGTPTRRILGAKPQHALEADLAAYLS